MNQENEMLVKLFMVRSLGRAIIMGKSIIYKADISCSNSSSNTHLILILGKVLTLLMPQFLHLSAANNNECAHSVRLWRI